MTNKPLHVRRLQKYLSEWQKRQLTNQLNERPAFRKQSSSLAPIQSKESMGGREKTVSLSDLLRQPVAPTLSDFTNSSCGCTQTGDMGDESERSVVFTFRNCPFVEMFCCEHFQAFHSSMPSRIYCCGDSRTTTLPNRCNTAPASTCPAGSSGGCSGRRETTNVGKLRSKHNGEGIHVSMLTNVELKESQLRAVMASAKRLIRNLPHYPAKQLNPRKKIASGN